MLEEREKKNVCSIMVVFPEVQWSDLYIFLRLLFFLNCQKYLCMEDGTLNGGVESSVCGVYLGQVPFEWV